jgi:phytoene dehydrogenase-like protein
MTIPSSLDPTLAPKGHHVASLFVQYTPYNLRNGKSWEDPKVKEEFADR